MAKLVPTALLHPADLVEDREVYHTDGDKLAHAQIAKQLAELAVTVAMPSNIALYGPWGSGKSGIGNIIREILSHKKGVRFVRFDAFKYAETPLRRNFISAIATELGVTEKKFHDDLYTGKSRTDIALPASRIFKILGIFAGSMAVISAVIGIIAAIVAALQTGPFVESFARLVMQAVTVSMVPAALLSTLISLANKTLQVDRSEGKPDSDEQFERIFNDLVKKSGALRLVIFVDELDRCAADDVVATLDAVRTFLGVSSCVFIIAADQQVLEESLTRSAKQETPANIVNPYYSTGSAYLDKVFQYQVSLPPLLSQRITRFAADLVGNRGGLWSKINTDYVVSILIPTHVNSPRRVKHLLNAFALTYRLAEDRFNRKLLSEDPYIAAASIAKLVCLRVEFPLFSRDLEIDARLPEMVLALVADPHKSALDKSWPERAVKRAEAYASGGEAPAKVMFVEGNDGEDARGSMEGTIAHSNQQLLDYLSRTRLVAGPSQSLVFMHSSGAAFGLDGQTASAVEEAAENADVDSVRERLRGASIVKRQGIIELLAHLIRASVGVGAINAARTLLKLYAADESIPVDRLADSVSADIAGLMDEHRGMLDDDTVGAAWTLAAQGSATGAGSLRHAILMHADAVRSLDCSFILRNPAPALADNRGMVASLVAKTVVRRQGEHSACALYELDDETLLDLLQASTDAVAKALEEAFEEYEAAEKVVEAATSSAASAASGHLEPVATEVDEGEDIFDPQLIIREFGRLAHSRLGSSQITDQLLRLLLAINNKAARDAVESFLGDINYPIMQESLVGALLISAEYRAVSRWPKWFNAIGERAITPAHSVAVGKLVGALWRSTRKADTSLSAAEIDAALGVLIPVVKQLPQEMRPDLTEDVASDIARPVTDDESAAKCSTLRWRMQPLIDSELVDQAELYRQIFPTLRDNFARIDDPVARDSELGTYLLNDVVMFVREGITGNASDQDHIRGLVEDVLTSTLVAEPFRTQLALSLIQASTADIADFASVPTLAGVEELLNQFGGDASDAVQLWIILVNPSVADTGSLIRILRDREVFTGAIGQALTDLRSAWSVEDRLSLLRPQVIDSTAAPLSVEDAALLGLSEIDGGSVATLLIARFEGCSNSRERQAVIKVWEIAKITDHASRKRLFQSIVLPLLQSPIRGQVEIALYALERIGSPLPHGIKAALGQAVKSALSAHKSLERRAERAMEPLGYPTQRYGWFSSKTTINYSG